MFVELATGAALLVKELLCHIRHAPFSLSDLA
jgi:hypothetical protein